MAAIAANWRALDRLGPAETAAVVKADAYGCGLPHVVSVLAEAGCRTFFAAALAEAERAAAAAPPNAAIYVLSAPVAALAEDWPEDPRIRPVLNSLDEARRFAARRDPRPVALQTETGMNRLGVSPDALGELAALGPDATPAALIMSHLATADAPPNALLQQQKRAFDQSLEVLRPAFPSAAASLSATGGALLGLDFAYDMVRPGVGLYGGAPFVEATPAVALSAPLLRVWEVAPGALSGYGGVWRAARPSRLATLPLGYADGVPRAVGQSVAQRPGRSSASLAGGEAPIIGRISMDLTVIDVTDVHPAPRAGDTAWLLESPSDSAPRLHDPERPLLGVDRMAEAADTIGYEVLTRLDAAGRLQKRYWPA